MIEIAEERLKGDAFPPFEGKPFLARFLAHNIELHPLDTAERFDVAIIRSTLHHLFNPIAALRNIGECLKPEGIVVIIEGAAPAPGSKADEEMRSIMKEYNTLERAYTRRQMSDILALAGFPYYSFYSSINGFFEETMSSSAIEPMLAHEKGKNNLVASRQQGSIERIQRNERTKADSSITSMVVFSGLYDEEKGDAGPFRWSMPLCTLYTLQRGTLSIVLSSFYPVMASKSQTISIKVNHESHSIITLSDSSRHKVQISSKGKGDLIELYSESVFIPRFYGMNDSRLLSFMLEIQRIE